MILCGAISNCYTTLFYTLINNYFALMRFKQKLPSPPFKGVWWELMCFQTKPLMALPVSCDNFGIFPLLLTRIQFKLEWHLCFFSTSLVPLTMLQELILFQCTITNVLFMILLYFKQPVSLQVKVQLRYKAASQKI